MGTLSKTVRFCLYPIQWVAEVHFVKCSQTIRDGFMRKKCCSFGFGFCPDEGGGAAQFFWHLFISAFLVDKRSLFPPNCQQLSISYIYISDPTNNDNDDHNDDGNHPIDSV